MNGGTQRFPSTDSGGEPWSGGASRILSGRSPGKDFRASSGQTVWASRGRPPGSAMNGPTKNVGPPWTPPPARNTRPKNRDCSWVACYAKASGGERGASGVNARGATQPGLCVKADAPSGSSLFRHEHTLPPRRSPAARFASSFQPASAAQLSRADSSSRHFSRSALICSTQPRACRTSFAASRYSFQRNVATVAVR